MNFRGRAAATSPGRAPPSPPGPPLRHPPPHPPAFSLQSHSMKCYEIVSWEGGKQKARRLFRKICGGLSDVPKKLPLTPLLHFQGRGKSGLKIMSQKQQKQTRPGLVFSTDFSRRGSGAQGGWGQTDEAQREALRWSHISVWGQIRTCASGSVSRAGYGIGPSFDLGMLIDSSPEVLNALKIIICPIV